MHESIVPADPEDADLTDLQPVVTVHHHRGIPLVQHDVSRCGSCQDQPQLGPASTALVVGDAQHVARTTGGDAVQVFPGSRIDLHPDLLPSLSYGQLLRPEIHASTVAVPMGSTTALPMGGIA